MDHLNHCIVEAVEENDMEKIKEFGDAISEICKVSIMIVNVEKKVLMPPAEGGGMEQ